MFVGVTSAHRGDAFDACRFVMDYLKTRAPFWKKEMTADGARWVEARTSDDEAAQRWEKESRPVPDTGVLTSIALLAIDWGTTSARAYAVDANGRICGDAQRTAWQSSRSQATASRARSRSCSATGARSTVPRFAAGMIGSRQGWVEAPYVAVPRGVRFARRATRLDARARARDRTRD